MKARHLTPAFVASIPAEPEPGNLYISMAYETAVHLCACGCGGKVVTPFGPNDWTLTFDGTVSLNHSVGNGQFACSSHYCIQRNQIVWLPKINAAATRTALGRDQRVHQPPVATKRSPWWRRIRGY